MIEQIVGIAVIWIMLLSMARHGRRRYRRYQGAKIDQQLQLGTLAGNTLVGVVLSNAVNDTTWVSSVKAVYGLSNVTAVAQTGPVLCGWAHSDYTDTEVEQWVEALNSWDTGDKITQEQSRRKIRQVGLLHGGAAVAPPTVMNDGMPVTTKLGWYLESGDMLRFWCYNSGTVAFATTDPLVTANGKANLWPTG